MPLRPRPRECVPRRRICQHLCRVCGQRLFSVEYPILQLTLPEHWSHCCQRAALSVASGHIGAEMTLLQDFTGSLALSEPSCAAPPSLLAPDERRAPTDALSLAKRAALIACWN